MLLLLSMSPFRMYTRKTAAFQKKPEDKSSEKCIVDVNLINKGVTGKQAEKMLDAANITCNKNTVPNDPQSAFTTSGIRLGTAAVTTRGFNTADMDVVAQAISLVIDDMEKNKEEAMALVKSLTDKYPLYE